MIDTWFIYWQRRHICGYPVPCPCNIFLDFGEWFWITASVKSRVFGNTRPHMRCATELPDEYCWIFVWFVGVLLQPNRPLRSDCIPARFEPPFSFHNICTSVTSPSWRTFHFCLCLSCLYLDGSSMPCTAYLSTTILPGRPACLSLSSQSILAILYGWASTPEYCHSSGFYLSDSKISHDSTGGAGRFKTAIEPIKNSAMHLSS